MTATYQISTGLRLKYVKINGETSLQELRALAETFRNDAKYSERLRQLIDLSGLTRTAAKFQDVLTLRNFYTQTFSPVTEPIKVAIFAPTSLGYGMSRMFSSLMAGSDVMQIEVFKKRALALSWLQINLDESAIDQRMSPEEQVS